MQYSLRNIGGAVWSLAWSVSCIASFCFCMFSYPLIVVLLTQDVATEVQQALYTTLSEFEGDVEDEDNLEILIEQQFEALQKALKIPHKASEARLMVAKKFLTLFRSGKLGQFVLDDVPDISTVS